MHQNDLAILQSARGIDDRRGAGTVPISGVDIPRHRKQTQRLGSLTNRGVQFTIGRAIQRRLRSASVLNCLIGLTQLIDHLLSAIAAHVRMRIAVILNLSNAQFLWNQRWVARHTLPPVKPCDWCEAVLLEQIDERRSIRGRTVVESNSDVAITSSS